jgi:hypothetical protein
MVGHHGCEQHIRHDCDNVAEEIIWCALITQNDGSMIRL